MVTKKMARKFQDQQRALQRGDAEQIALSPEEKLLRRQRRLLDFGEPEKSDD